MNIYDHMILPVVTERLGLDPNSVSHWKQACEHYRSDVENLGIQLRQMHSLGPHSVAYGSKIEAYIIRYFALYAFGMQMSMHRCDDKDSYLKLFFSENRKLRIHAQSAGPGPELIGVWRFLLLNRVRWGTQSLEIEIFDVEEQWREAFSALWSRRPSPEMIDSKYSYTISKVKKDNFTPNIYILQNCLLELSVDDLAIVHKNIEQTIAGEGLVIILDQDRRVKPNRKLQDRMNYFRDKYFAIQDEYLEMSMDNFRDKYFAIQDEYLEMRMDTYPDNFYKFNSIIDLAYENPHMRRWTVRHRFLALMNKTVQQQ